MNYVKNLVKNKRFITAVTIAVVTVGFILVQKGEEYQSFEIAEEINPTEG